MRTSLAFVLVLSALGACTSARTTVNRSATPAPASSADRDSAAVATDGSEDACDELPDSEGSWPFSLRALRTSCATFAQRHDCSVLGNSLSTGTEGVTDHPRALSFARCACSAADAECVTLGTLYEHGHGVPVDLARAATFYDRACNAGDGLGCADFGLFFERGNGMDADIPRAKALYERACELGSADGCAALGYLYERGLGVSPDLGRAATLYEPACEKDSPTACNNLAVMFHNGEGRPHDPVHARELYAKSCDAHYALGCQNLGNMYRRGSGGLADPKKAAAIYRGACQWWDPFGRDEVCAHWARTVLEGHDSTITRQRAAEMLDDGCKRDVAAACVGVALWNLQQSPRNIPEAVRAAKHACALGDKQGCDAAGAMASPGR